MIYAYVWLTFEIFNNRGCLVALGHFIPVWIWAVFGQKMLMHMHHCSVHTGTHTHSDTNWYSRLTAELSCWTEKFWEGISPPALLHWGGSSDLPLPLWSGNYAVMAPSWCQHRTLCSLLSTWLSALLLVFLFSLLSWNSICLPSWLKDIFLPFPSSNQSNQKKCPFFAAVSHFSMTAFAVPRKNLARCRMVSQRVLTKENSNSPWFSWSWHFLRVFKRPSIFTCSLTPHTLPSIWITCYVWFKWADFLAVEEEQGVKRLREFSKAKESRGGKRGIKQKQQNNTRCENG